MSSLRKKLTVRFRWREPLGGAGVCRVVIGGVLVTSARHLAEVSQ